MIQVCGTAIALSKLVNSSGLCLDILGALLLFRFGLPAKIDRDGHRYLIMEGEDASEKAQANLYDRIGAVAVLLLIAGFALQLASNFL